MEIEIVEAYIGYDDIDGKPMRKIQVENRFLTWEEREKDFKDKGGYQLGGGMLTYHTLDHIPRVNSWYSINRNQWEQCKKVIRICID